MNSNTSVELATIANALQTLKQLEVIESFYHDIGFAKYLNVKDSSNSQFSVLIFQISDHDDDTHPNQQFLQKWRQLSLDQLKQKATNLQFFNHENIAKCFDSFQIESFFYVQIERIERTLLNWLNQQQHHNYKQSPMTKSMFIKIALQMLESAQYLHKQRFVLHRERILESFMIDSQNQIKLFHFNFPEKVEVSMFQKIFLYQLENSEQFYYPSMLLDEKDIKFVYNYYQTDIWSLVICFLELNSISYLNILEFIQKKSISSLPLYTLGYDLISIFIHMLQPQSYTIYPSIPCLIQQFKNAQNDLLTYLKSTNILGYNSKGITETQIECKSEEQSNLDKQKKYAINYSSAIETFLEKVDLKLSQNLFLECQKQFPNNDFIYLYLMYTNIENSDYYFQKALEINPSNDVAYFFKSRLDDDPLKKIDYLRKAIEIDTKNECYQISLGGYYRNQGDINKAIEHYQNVTQINECCFRSLCTLGYLTFLQERYKESVEYCLRSIEINPSYGQSYHQLGNLYKKINKTDKAIECYEKCLQINPEDEKAYIKLAFVYCDIKNDVMKAIEILNLGISKNLNSGRIHKFLADVYESNFQREEAVKNYRIALKYNSEDDICYNNIGLIHSDENKDRKAIEYYKKALEIKNDETTSINIGSSYISLQQYEKVILLQKDRTDSYHPFEQFNISKRAI